MYSCKRDIGRWKAFRQLGPWLMSALVLPVILSGCVTTNTESPDQLVADAAAAARANEKLDPEYRKLLLSHGQRALEGEKYEEAVGAYRRVLDAEPKNPEATFGMAETMLAVADYAAALSYYRALEKNEAFHARAYQGEGIVLLNLGQHEQSTELLKKAVAVDAKLWRAWNALGRTLDIQGKHDEARTDYDKALAIEPNSAVVLNNRGVSNMLSGQFPAAEKDLRNAISQDRELERARGNLRLVLAWQGKYAEALADVGRINAPAVLNNIGYIAMKRGDLSHAEAYFAQAMQLSPAFYDKADRNLKFLHELKQLQKVADTNRG
jgi:Flp pilus assembly protein TadD